MLSRLVPLKGSVLCSLARSEGKDSALWLCMRAYASAGHGSHKPAGAVVPKQEEVQLTVQQHMENWAKANKQFYGPDRDHKNFPIFKIADRNPPAKLGFIPGSWFKALYDKTGVTGPYLFCFGATTYLLSKEWWVVEHRFVEFLSFWAVIIFIHKMWGSKIMTYLDGQSQERMERKWFKPIRDEKEHIQKAVAEAEKEIWRVDGMNHLFQAKKENVDLQLEAIYRQRLSQVHQAVKKRLDYQLDIERTKRQYQQKHLVNWIVSSVKQSITPQQEKDALNKCILDLKNLANVA